MVNLQRMILILEWILPIVILTTLKNTEDFVQKQENPLERESMMESIVKDGGVNGKGRLQNSNKPIDQKA